MGNMLADFFTKQLQVTPFRKMRDTILNLPSSENWRSALECVGIYGIKIGLEMTKRGNKRPMIKNEPMTNINGTNYEQCP